MATIKSFTSLEQCRKLSKILPLESADMLWEQHGAESYVTIKPWTTRGKSIGCHCLSCWSLAALLNILSDYTLQTNTDGTVFVVCESKKPMISDAYDNPIDACVAMIEKLYELNLL